MLPGFFIYCKCKCLQFWWISQSVDCEDFISILLQHYTLVPLLWSKGFLNENNEIKMFQKETCLWTTNWCFRNSLYLFLNWLLVVINVTDSIGSFLFHFLKRSFTTTGCLKMFSRLNSGLKNYSGVVLLAAKVWGWTFCL